MTLSTLHLTMYKDVCNAITLTQGSYHNMDVCQKSKVISFGGGGGGGEGGGGGLSHSFSRGLNLLFWEVTPILWFIAKSAGGAASKT